MRDIGYETDNAILNLGSLFFILMVYFIVVLNVSVLSLIKDQSVRLKKAYDWFIPRTFFGCILGVVKEGYIEFLIAGILNIGFNNFDEFWSDKLGYGVSYLGIFFAIIIFPYTSIKMLMIDIDDIEKETYQIRYGPLIEEVRTNDKWTISFFPIFAARRFLFILLAFILRETAVVY